MYKDFFTVNGIPQNLVLSAAAVLFLVSIAPLFPRLRVFGVLLPRLSGLGSAIASALSATGLMLMVVGFQPRWLDRNEYAERVPFCHVSSTLMDGKKYILDWFTDSKYPSSSLVTLDKEILSKEVSGTFEMNWDGNKDIVVFEVSSRNRYGECSQSVDLWDPSVDYNIPMVCEINIDRVDAAIDDIYNIYWKVSGPKKILAFINGSSVALRGSGITKFTGPNYDRYYLVANSGGHTCEAQAQIISK